MNDQIYAEAVSSVRMSRPLVTNALLWIVLLVGYVALAILLYHNSDRSNVSNQILVAVIGVATGATELLSRYRDKPLEVVKSIEGIAYMAINALAALLALYLLDYWKLMTDHKDVPLRVLVAGGAAMAFFRSGLFTARIGSTDIPVGPNLILKVFLDTLDREYDRRRAKPRANLVGEIMDDIGFERAKQSLPELCFNLMQNVTSQERKTFADEVNEMGKLSIDPKVLSLALGLKLLSIVDEQTLMTAVGILRSSIGAFKALTDDLAQYAARLNFETQAEDLLRICDNNAHKSRRLKDASAIKQFLDPIRSITADASLAKPVTLVQAARRQYGEDIVLDALRVLIPAVSMPPPPPPPSPPPPPPPSASPTPPATQ